MGYSRSLVTKARPLIAVIDDEEPVRKGPMPGGASAFLRKPVPDRTLLDAISAATSSAQPGGPNGHEIFSELRSPIPGVGE